MKKLASLCAVACLTVFTISAQAGGGTSILSLTGKLSGASDIGGGTILKQTIDQDAIINLAQGRFLGTPIPANEILALILDCNGGSGATLSIYDTTGGSNILVLATTTDAVQINTATKGIAGIPFQIGTVGDSTNGIQSGTVILQLKSKVSGGCVSSFSAAVSGVLDTVVTLQLGTFSNGVIVSKGKLAGTALVQ